MIVFAISITVMLILFYAIFPWLAGSVLRQQLAERGFGQADISIGYPGLNSLQLTDILLEQKTDKQTLHAKVKQIDIYYRLLDLVTGRVKNIVIPEAEVKIRQSTIPAEQDKQQAEGGGLPLMFLSGEWLRDFPVQAFSLARFKLTSQTGELSENRPKSRLNASVKLVDGKLSLSGSANLPVLKSRIRFNIQTDPRGTTDISLTNLADPSEALLSLQVKPRAQLTSQTEVTDEILILDGELQTKLERLVPVVAELVPAMQDGKTLKGKLNGHWQVRLTDSDWQVKGKLELNGLTGHWGKQALPLLNMKLVFDGNPAQVNFKPELADATRAMVLTAEGQYQLATGQIQAGFSLHPVVFSESGFVLSQILSDWPYPFDVSGGQIAMQGKLAMQKSLSITAELQLQNLAGRFNEIGFVGMNANMALLKEQGIGTTRDVKLTVDLVEAGFPVEKLELLFALLPKPGKIMPAVNIKTFHARTMGGQVRLTPFIFDMDGVSEFNIVLEHLDLGKLMALQKQQDLTGTGKLYGAIPVEYSSKTLVVKQGNLGAIAPGGVIRFKPNEKVAAMAKSNVSVDMVVKVLRDFRYQVLDMTTDYQQTGELNMKVQLQGRNPQWQKGQPVHLNLNVEQNILTLLRSLQLSEDISSRMQKHYEKQ